MLSADGQFQCFRESSSKVVGPFFIYSYMCISCIMLVNMLIAMMGKTFDNVFEAQESLFLFLKARTEKTWLKYPAAPPPLNFLSLPYAVCIGLQFLGKSATGSKKTSTNVPNNANKPAPPKPSSSKRRFSVSKADLWSDEQAIKLPHSYLEELSPDSPADGLCKFILNFMDEQGDSVIREDRWKTEMMRAVGSRNDAAGKSIKDIVAPVQAAADVQSKEMAALTAAVVSMQAAVASIQAAVDNQAKEMAELKMAFPQMMDGQEQYSVLGSYTFAAATTFDPLTAAASPDASVAEQRALVAEFKAATSELDAAERQLAARRAETLIAQI